MNSSDTDNQIPAILIEKYEAFVADVVAMGLGIEMVGIIIKGLPMQNWEQSAMPIPVQYRMDDDNMRDLIPNMLTIYPKKEKSNEKNDNVNESPDQHPPS